MAFKEGNQNLNCMKWLFNIERVLKIPLGKKRRLFYLWCDPTRMAKLVL